MQAVLSEPRCNGTTPPLLPVRLNLGAGGHDVPGFVSIDRDHGTEAYPLCYPDGSVAEILASHVLEHFSHREVGAVLEHWVSKLEPGGKIRIAVPDFEDVARRYLAGEPVNVQGYVMGGHADADDRHGCVFDRECLLELMTQVGLERIGDWRDPAAGFCCNGPHTLNLVGFKPSGGPPRRLETTRAVLSVPRFGPLMHPRCAERAFFSLGIPGKSTQSCFWHQQISELMEEAIADPACEYVLTMDFDTVFTAADVMELHRLLDARPEYDAVFPLQAKRGSKQALFGLVGPDGKPRKDVTVRELHVNLLEAGTGHFGLTVFRADSLRKFARPWMVPEPNPATGRYDGDHTDADIDFWRRFRAAGFRVALAPKVVVGHIEEAIAWPGPELQRVYQTTADYEKDGIPASVLR